MFADTEAEVASLREVALQQLVFLDLEAALQNLLGLGPPYGYVHGDLFISSDAKGTDCVSCLAYGFSRLQLLISRSRFLQEGSREILTVDRGLAAQLFKHLGCAGKSIARFADGDVQDELLDAEFPHGV